MSCHNWRCACNSFSAWLNDSAQMASVKRVDEASVEKKLMGVKSTQESIQSLCLWALHHKAQHDSIVRIWLNILKKCKLNAIMGFLATLAFIQAAILPLLLVDIVFKLKWDISVSLVIELMWMSDFNCYSFYKMLWRLKDCKQLHSNANIST